MKLPFGIELPWFATPGGFWVWWWKHVADYVDGKLSKAEIKALARLDAKAKRMRNK